MSGKDSTFFRRRKMTTIRKDDGDNFPLWFIVLITFLHILIATALFGAIMLFGSFLGKVFPLE